MLDHLHVMIKGNPLSFGIINFLLGLLVGHWLAIGRDKRKEFNQAAMPIRTALLQQLHGLPNKSFRPDAVSNDQFVAFSDFVGAFSSSKYLREVKEYHDCFELHPYPDTRGQRYKVVRNSDYQSLETATKKLLKYCKLK